MIYCVHHLCILLGSRWVLHGDDGGYFSMGSVAYKPPTEKQWNGYESGLIASGGTLTLLTFDCSRGSILGIKVD